jgi:hypothetical protein
MPADISCFLLEHRDLGEQEKGELKDKVLADVGKWLERFDCIVIGPGLGRDPLLLVQHGYLTPGVTIIYSLLKEYHVTIELSWNLMGLLVGSWSSMMFHWLFCIHINIILPNCGACLDVVFKVE